MSTSNLASGQISTAGQVSARRLARAQERASQREQEGTGTSPPKPKFPTIAEHKSTTIKAKEADKGAKQSAKAWELFLEADPEAAQRDGAFVVFEEKYTPAAAPAAPADDAGDVAAAEPAQEADVVMEDMADDEKPGGGWQRPKSAKAVDRQLQRNSIYDKPGGVVELLADAEVTAAPEALPSAANEASTEEAEKVEVARALDDMNNGKEGAAPAGGPPVEIEQAPSATPPADPPPDAAAEGTPAAEEEEAPPAEATALPLSDELAATPPADGSAPADANSADPMPAEAKSSAVSAALLVVPEGTGGAPAALTTAQAPVAAAVPASNE